MDRQVDGQGPGGALGAGVAALCLVLLALPAAPAWSALWSDQQASRQELAAPDRQEQDPAGLADVVRRSLQASRRGLEKAGFMIDAKAVLEGFNNFRGGLRTDRMVGASTVDLSLTADTEKLLHWPGGTFYVDIEDHAGGNPTTELVGDLQVFDKLNTAPYLQVFELWYQQKLFAGKVRLKIGKVDANSEFSVIDNGLEFENSSAQVSPTVFLLPTTPDPMPSVNLFFTPRPAWYAAFGVYDANRTVNFGNLHGSPEEAQLSDNGVFLIGEVGLRWRQAPVAGHAGNLKLGTWGHTGTFTRFDGGQQHGTSGWYAIFDQTLWRPPGGVAAAGRGVRVFLEYGSTQNRITVIDWHAGGGLAWTGPLAARPEDVTGFTPQYAHISSQAALPHAYELALEWFYKAQITPWAALQPDLQFIEHPGGRYPAALVGTLRLAVDF